MRQPWPWQKPALDYALPREQVALFMEMRLGKCLVALRWARYHKAKRILIVIPLSTLAGWIKECKEERWLVCVLRGRLQGTLLAAWGKGAYLTNYEQVTSNPQILEQSWDAIILDECVKIKNPKAQITKTLINETRHVNLRCMLSGDPRPEKWEDIYSQMAWLENGPWMRSANFWKWRETYFLEFGYKWKPSKGGLKAIHRALEANAFAMTRKAAGVGPAKIKETQYVGLSPAQRRAMNQVLDKLRYKDTFTRQTIVAATWLRRIAGGHEPTTPYEHEWPAKLRLLMDLLTGTLRKERVVVGASFTAEIDTIYQACQDAGIPSVTLDGRTPIEDRDKSFKKRSTRVAVVQPAVATYGSMGLDPADTLIMYSNAASGNIRHQFEDRLIHPSKTDSILILDLLTEGTCDVTLLNELGVKGRGNRELVNHLWKVAKEQQ